ncbi:MAG: FAD-dependent oxidoreductase [Gammaproteobacteria bacterium]
MQLRWEDRRGDNTPHMERPVVVVGAGIAGQRVVQELLALDATCPVVWYGSEAVAPYDREALSTALAGGGDGDRRPAPVLPAGAEMIRRHGCHVIAVDRPARAVVDAEGRLQPYSDLVLATGSRPVLPDVAGIHLDGVYTLYDACDAERLAARTARSRRTVVLGGGPLGVELARAMQRGHTEVTIVERAPYLLHRQLDATAAEWLRDYLLGAGMQVLLTNTVTEIIGTRVVEAVRLRSGRLLRCDTLVLATGVRARTELAQAAGLRVGRAVLVTDYMESSDPHIYAVGDCAEHGGRVYGSAAAAEEQAVIAARCILRDPVRYRGSLVGSALKVVDRPVASIGQVGGAQHPAAGLEVCFVQMDGGVYRKLVLRRGRLAGAIAVGGWAEWGQVQEAVRARRRLWPWQLRRFTRTGLLWSRPTPAGPALGPPGARRLGGTVGAS